jgi:hypothetical protein
MPRRKKTEKSPTKELLPAVRAAIRVADQAMARARLKRTQAKRPKR